ncbi:hypothetical protein SASPL_118788 [Salvia splendens]|uniref:Bicarbonate transporter-like transmembrane domain-containing protein n=1 Tax=Salvia splendens TaxID=180675 RepID=A0A8X8Y2C7_SALSN|nr:hypothetical protein SASPL_118788 [Salvia splendens]
MPLIKRIPTSVLWGYFAYMAIDSLLGIQFWERMVFLFVAPSRRYMVLEQFHASYVETVPFRHIAAFTLFEFLFLIVCFGVTWIPVVGVLFPLPFFLLIAIQQHLFPKIIQSQYLRELDVAEYEENEGTSQCSLGLSLREVEVHFHVSEQVDMEMCDAEILDELPTNRGELKVRSWIMLND